MDLEDINITISRGNNAAKVALLLPVWKKSVIEDEFLRINIPLLCIETIAREEEDLNIATIEALQSFFLDCEKFGEGIEQELLVLGWDVINTDNGRQIFTYKSKRDDFVLEKIIETEDDYIDKELNLEAA